MANDTIIKSFKTLGRKMEIVFRGYRYIGNSRLYGARRRLRAKIGNTVFYGILKLFSLNYATKRLFQ